MGFAKTHVWPSGSEIVINAVLSGGTLVRNGSIRAANCDTGRNGRSPGGGAESRLWAAIVEREAGSPNGSTKRRTPNAFCRYWEMAERV
jgi:hypothetical protein